MGQRQRRGGKRRGGGGGGGERGEPPPRGGERGKGGGGGEGGGKWRQPPLKWLNDVKQVEASHQAWLDSTEFKSGIVAVQAWRSKPRGTPPNEKPARPTSESARDSKIREDEPE